MPRTLRIAAQQSAPVPIGTDRSSFADEVVALSGRADLVVYPELHLFGSETWPDTERTERLRASAVPIDSELVQSLGDLARRAGVWLIPGSICERGEQGELFNTALVFSPDGDLVARYRKVFPWRPFEPYDPGDRFVTVDLDGLGRIGLSICYDAWFPEVSRHLAWMGAEVVVNIVKTTTPDRAQELVLARANSIVNQTFTLSVNCAGPIGRGLSLVVDPDGEVLDASDDGDPVTLVTDLDLDRIAEVREHGTAGTNRMWSQFRPADAPIELPLYAGRIDPERWHPAATGATPLAGITRTRTANPTR
ncbi:carbon-nitrogen hydrolase family protein [Agromyces luteolus]|uniref:Carbon-nitrogen hydrolase family protein n=1 Tax=Agromyces luteolus TaxID=88373 RepID=A0A7C9HJG6_9MICO|nr:carbon-nitrogen hydrolase family protein [Agromyces luteolus]MUN08587.1 carbon-nitrogen hydrolase family protein [Agromyces luteolus]